MIVPETSTLLGWDRPRDRIVRELWVTRLPMLEKEALRAFRDHGNTSSLPGWAKRGADALWRNAQKAVA